MAKVIRVEHLSKAYQLGDFGTGTISRDLERFWARVRGKEDPFLKIGEVNDRAKKGESDVVWSLNDLNFEVEAGDAIGVIGRNGAGKSTLLKILSRVTYPTVGSIKVRGRIASLLEVGTGFHPELTGKENVYLNGAILGMRKAEIKRKFDEIIDFAGVERYVNTPVKRYSSGMYVRLAFAVAAHLESEILIVDEVLAVGDAEFQKKCLGKMGEVRKAEGRTVLFVSHNMDSVRALCDKGMVLDCGNMLIYDEVNAAISTYLRTAKNDTMTTRVSGLALNNDVILELFSINKSSVATHEDIDFTIHIRSKQLNHFNSIALNIFDEYEQKSAFIDLRCDALYKRSDDSNRVVINGTLKNLPLLPGIYRIGIHIQSNMLFDDFLHLLQFEVRQKELTDDLSPYPIHVRGRSEIDYEFNIL
jgi:lipopolysaccharide transport system ATP-binding protein